MSHLRLRHLHHRRRQARPLPLAGLQTLHRLRHLQVVHVRVTSEMNSPHSSAPLTAFEVYRILRLSDVKFVPYLRRWRISQHIDRQKLLVLLLRLHLHLLPLRQQLSHSAFFPPTLLLLQMS